MTRISILDPVYMSDQHCFSDLREQNRIGNLYKNWKKRNRKPALPEDFRFGTGHVLFFYNKGLYLQKRFNALYAELEKRNATNYSFPFNNTWSEDSEDFQDWEPSEHDIELAKQRVFSRLNKNLDWYKYYKKPIDNSFIEYYIR